MTLVMLLALILVAAALCWLVKTQAPEPLQTPLLMIIVTVTVVYVLVQLFPGLMRTSIHGG